MNPVIPEVYPVMQEWREKSVNYFYAYIKDAK